MSPGQFPTRVAVLHRGSVPLYAASSSPDSAADRGPIWDHPPVPYLTPRGPISVHPRFPVGPPAGPISDPPRSDMGPLLMMLTGADAPPMQQGHHAAHCDTHRVDLCTVPRGVVR